jgi:hypothetical protein
MLRAYLTKMCLHNRANAMGLALALAMPAVFVTNTNVTGILTTSFFNTFSIVIAAFVTLSKSPKEGLLVVIAASLPALLGYLLHLHTSSDGVLAVNILLLGILSNLITWFFAAILRKYMSWSLTIEIATLVGVFTVILAHVIYPDLSAWWFRKLSHAVADPDVQKLASKTDSLERIQLFKAFSYQATGVMTAMFLGNTLFQLLWARAWQAVEFNPQGLKQEIKHVRLSPFTAILFMIFLGLFLFKELQQTVVADVVPLFYAAGAASGLSLLGYFAGLVKFSWVWFSAGCILIYISSPASLIVVSMIALLDTWVDFRAKKYLFRF